VGGSRRLLIYGGVFLVVYLALSITVGGGVFESVDVDVFFAVNSWAPATVMDSLMVLLSLYGREVVWGAAIVVLFVFGGEREKRAALTMGLLFMLLIGAGYLAKELVFRTRPYNLLEGVRLLVPVEADSSFPSGHTLIVAGGTVVALLKLRRWQATLLTIEAALVAISRIYVGVHYPTDIIGGALLGVGFALVICSYPRPVDDIYERIPESIKGRGSASLPAEVD